MGEANSEEMSTKSARPSTAGSFRTSASAIGNHGAKNKFANVKSRYGRPASAPAAGRKAQPKSGTATASKIIKHNGDMFAVKHHHKLTGYKLSQQLGEDVKTECTTTNQHVFKKPQMPTIAAPANRKPLVPYQMNARRSQLPTEFPHEAKRCVRYCHERNVSQIKLGDPGISSTTKSISSVFHCGLSSNIPSSSNSGIFSEWTKRHRKGRGV